MIVGNVFNVIKRAEGATKEGRRVATTEHYYHPQDQRDVERRWCYWGLGADCSCQHMCIRILQLRSMSALINHDFKKKKKQMNYSTPHVRFFIQTVQVIEAGIVVCLPGRNWDLKGRN